MFRIRYYKTIYLSENIFQFKNGFKLGVFNARNCGDQKQVIRMLNTSYDLSDKCEVITHSCSQIRQYKSALVRFSNLTFTWLFDYFQVEMKVFDGDIVFQNTKFNLCQKKSTPDLIRCNLATFAVPNRCAYNGSSLYCNDNRNKFTLSVLTQRMLALFSSLKRVQLRLSITHDTGKSCFMFESNVTKVNWEFNQFEATFTVSHDFRSDINKSKSIANSYFISKSLIQTKTISIPKYLLPEIWNNKNPE